MQMISAEEGLVSLGMKLNQGISLLNDILVVNYRKKSHQRRQLSCPNPLKLLYFSVEGNLLPQTLPGVKVSGLAFWLMLINASLGLAQMFGYNGLALINQSDSPGNSWKIALSHLSNKQVIVWMPP